jgi:hypothetical protein
MALSSFTCVNIFNTLFNPGTITLPSISSAVGRVLVFQDQDGTFGTNPLTISTSGMDRFPNKTNAIVLRADYDYLTIVGGSDSIWYTISARTYQEMRTSTITVYSTIAFKIGDNSAVITADSDLRLLYRNFGFYASSIVYFDNFSVSSAQISTLNVNELNTVNFIADEIHWPLIQQQQTLDME